MTNPLIKFVNSVCVQTAVYWGNPVSDGYGKFSFDAAVEIECRWDDKTELMTDDNGREVVSKARLLLEQDVDEGAMIALAELTDLTASQIADPMKYDGAYTILRFAKTPLFKSTTEFVREAWLWHTDT